MRTWPPRADLKQVSPSLGLNFPSLGQGRGGVGLRPALCRKSSPKMPSRGWGAGVQSHGRQPGPRAALHRVWAEGAWGRPTSPGVPTAPRQHPYPHRLYAGGARRHWPWGCDGRVAVQMLTPSLSPSLVGRGRVVPRGRRHRPRSLRRGHRSEIVLTGPNATRPWGRGCLGHMCRAPRTGKQRIRPPDGLQAEQRNDEPWLRPEPAVSRAPPSGLAP